MAYPLSATLFLGAGNTGLTLTAALFDSANSAAAGLTTTTLVETDAGTGIYLWTGTVPDGHRGLIKFSSSGTVKTAVSVNAQELENPDVKTSTRSSHTAADVWTSGTRTLTSFGTLAADTAAAVWASGTRTLTSFGTLVADVTTAVWAAGTRTLTSFGTLVADVWAYATRTLTTSITAVTPPPVITGDEVTITRGDTMVLSFTGLGNITGRTKLWLTVKESTEDEDADAVFQIEESGGLLVLNGAPTTTSNGTTSVTNATTGAVTFTLKPAASAALALDDGLAYDVQVLIAGVVSTLTQGDFIVSRDVTRSFA